jgi:hypothetical protein
MNTVSARQHVETVVRWCFLTSAGALMTASGLCILAAVEPEVQPTVALAIGVAGSIGTASMATATVVLRSRSTSPARRRSGSDLL